MPDTPLPEVERLAAVLRRHNEAPGADATITAASWERLARWAFDQAEITLTDEEFAVAWRRLWQCAFHGATYKQDAAHVWAAIEGLRAPAPSPTGGMTP